MSPVRLAVVVPTRNRADLATRAVLSVLEQGILDVRLIVSDNSTSAAETSKLQSAMAGLGVTVIAPPTDLAMSAHWDWAIEQAQDRLNPTHITFLTDRMVFKQNALPMLLRQISHLSTSVIAYNHDRVEDVRRPIHIELTPSSWRLHQISSQLFLDEVAAGKPWQWITPRMLNCAVPVSLLHTLRSQSGHIFGSVAPDFYFGFRVASIVEEFYAWDAPLLVHYALARSNGRSYRTGVMSSDAHDFRRHMEGVSMETPFPTVSTVSNSIFHEYAVVARETGSSRFRVLDRETVARVIRTDANSLVPHELRSEVLTAVSMYSDRSRCMDLSRFKVERFKRAATNRVRHNLRRLAGVVAAESLPPSVIRSARLLPYLGFRSVAAAVEAARCINRVKVGIGPPAATILTLDPTGRDVVADSENASPAEAGLGESSGRMSQEWGRATFVSDGAAEVE